MEWITAWNDPVINLTSASTDGAQVVITEAEIEDMTEPTMVSGWVDVRGGITSPSGAAGTRNSGILFLGMQVIPTSVTTIAETPHPQDESDGDWFWYRAIPLVSVAPVGAMDIAESFEIHDQVRSARKLHEEDKIVFAYSWEITELTATPEVSFNFVARLLLKQS